jgi:hypothetical protein
MDGLGELKIFVNEKDYDRAKKIISEHLNRDSK